MLNNLYISDWTLTVRSGTVCQAIPHRNFAGSYKLGTESRCYGMFATATRFVVMFGFSSYDISNCWLSLSAHAGAFFL